MLAEQDLVAQRTHMDDVLQHVDAVGLEVESVLPPRTTASCSVGSEVLASHPRARLEPSTFFPSVENSDLANEMRSGANADDFARLIHHVCRSPGHQFEVQRWNIEGSRKVMTDWARVGRCWCWRNVLNRRCRLHVFDHRNWCRTGNIALVDVGLVFRVVSSAMSCS